MNNSVRLAAAIAAAIAIGSGCSRDASQTAAAPKETADQFVERLNRELTELGREQAAAGWAYATFINMDTEFLNAKATERGLEYFSNAVEAAKQYENQKLSPATARTLLLLKLGVAAPAPKDPAKRAELAAITSKMEGMYGAAKYCPKGPESCKDQEQLTDVIANSRNYDELTEAWTGWHSTARPLRKEYVRFVELANEGAGELGFKDLGAMWRSGYDMPPDDFTKEAARLWGQVKPLYDSLHCYVRGKLQKTYGKDRVPDGKPIPAHLLGNMWAQEWNNIYGLVEPYQGQPSLDVDAELKKFENGMSTSFEVLRIQTDLADAQVAEIRAVLDYNKALADLERAKGTLLASKGMKLETSGGK